VREGFDYYWRHGDDVRISTESISRAREAIATLELSLRQHGLLLNGSKCVLEKSDSYQRSLDAADALMEATREELVVRRIDELRAADEDELGRVMREAGHDWLRRRKTITFT
jgi:hypothetical protein